MPQEDLELALRSQLHRRILLLTVLQGVGSPQSCREAKGKTPGRDQGEGTRRAQERPGTHKPSTFGREYRYLEGNAATRGQPEDRPAGMIPNRGRAAPLPGYRQSRRIPGTATQAASFQVTLLQVRPPSVVV